MTCRTLSFRSGWATRSVVVVTAISAVGLLGCAHAAPPHDASAAQGRRAIPEWLPPYSSEQEKLLAPEKAPVQVPATRTYPNLDRFGYANDRVLVDPREAIRVTQMVAEVVEKSPRQYALLEARPELANWVAQYGPPGDDEPNPFLIAAVDNDGEARLVPASVSSDAKQSYDDATAKEKSGDAEAAVGLYRNAIKLSPDVPAFYVGLGHALETKSPHDAEVAYRNAISVDPTLSTAHEGLSAMLSKRGDLSGARLELAHALAYHPKSRVALSLAAAFTHGQNKRPRIEPYAVFFDVDSMGAVHVAAPPTRGARMYAGCRAIFRYEPELRASLFEMPPDEPYFLTAVEEILCTESAIGAYLVERGNAAEEGRRAPPDPQTEAMLKLAHSDGLLGYVMFEVLGKRRPERARTAPASVHQAMVGYVEKYVLDYDPSDEDGRFVAVAASSPLRSASSGDVMTRIAFLAP